MNLLDQKPILSHFVAKIGSFNRLEIVHGLGPPNNDSLWNMHKTYNDYMNLNYLKSSLGLI